MMNPKTNLLQVWRCVSRSCPANHWSSVGLVPRAQNARHFLKHFNPEHSVGGQFIAINLQRELARAHALPIIASAMQQNFLSDNWTTAQRRPYSTQEPKETKPVASEQAHCHSREGGHSHRTSCSHLHSHSHSWFGHSHSNGVEEDAHGAEKLIAVLEGHGDRGSRVTIIGLACNVVLTGAKGLGGWMLHSASLLADAGHSLSDLLGDFVTLVSWRMSKKSPTERYPYGFAKMETMGTTVISILLVGGALGIAFHSYHLFISALDVSASTLPPGPAQELLHNITSIAPDAPSLFTHGHARTVDPNAAWFAAISVLAKEWLYRITKVVADEEKSPVLLANAVHHRSDAYSSLVAFFAIMGTWFFPTIPLDPIGGLFVSFVILRQGLQLFSGAITDLTDAGISPKARKALQHALEPLIVAASPPESRIFAIEHLRARRSGSQLFVDLTAIVPGSISVHDTRRLEQKISQTLKQARKEIAEVRVAFEPFEREKTS